MCLVRIPSAVLPLSVLGFTILLDPGLAATAAPAAPRAVIAEYEGIIHPITAEFFDEVVAHADTTNAAVVVLVLRTPGGLLESTRTIVSRMIAARTPVVVFVGPSGARAASAGFIIALAADVAVMAPGTHIGAAHPVSAGGDESKGSETMAKKAASDVAAYARTLAVARGRNAALAAEAVTESRAFTNREALEASPPLIDFVAADVADVLRQLDGRAITRFDGRAATLETTGIVTERREMTRRQRFLSAIAHPQIAYFLLTLGMLGLTVELWNPGSVLPGVAGGLCLLLAFFAFQVLPVDTTGLLLVLFGLALLILELKVPSFGVLGIGGTISLLIGSVMLTNEIPGVSVGYHVIVPVVLALAGIIVVLGRLALTAQRSLPVTGVEGLIGAPGQSLTAVGPAQAGQIRVHGEIWRAKSATELEAGQNVRVLAVEGLTLTVERAESPSAGGERS
jgi:membrane-bound serine protease (ClpP class)